MSFRTRPLFILGIVAAAGIAHADFTETFEAGTQDVGDWILTTNSLRPRIIQPSGGNPDSYLYGEVSTAIPTWSTASTRYQPGFNDEWKRDSVFVGDYYAGNVGSLSVDLNVQQVGSWTEDRALTLKMMSWDTANDGVAYEATYTLPDFGDTVPSGWNHYDFNIAARSTTVPAGWEFTKGDGTVGTGADWAQFMHQVDLVGFGYWKPGYFYPSFGTWKLGIDNIGIHTQAVPEPCSLLALGAGMVFEFRRKRK